MDLLDVSGGQLNFCETVVNCLMFWWAAKLWPFSCEEYGNPLGVLWSPWLICFGRVSGSFQWGVTEATIPRIGWGSGSTGKSDAREWHDGFALKHKETTRATCHTAWEGSLLLQTRVSGQQKSILQTAKRTPSKQVQCVYIHMYVYYIH